MATGEVKFFDQVAKDYVTFESQVKEKVPEFEASYMVGRAIVISQIKDIQECYTKHHPEKCFNPCPFKVLCSQINKER